jgi:hypothetical protein
MAMSGTSKESILAMTNKNICLEVGGSKGVNWLAYRG